MAYAAAALEIFGMLKQGQAQKQALDYNAGVMKQEEATGLAQGTQQEDIVRRNSREQLGKQTAAFGSAGVGYGGSSAIALQSSVKNQELDALNTKYRAQLSAYGYGAQAGIDKSQGSQAGANSELMAGAALLKNMGPYYSSAAS